MSRVAQAFVAGTVLLGSVGCSAGAETLPSSTPISGTSAIPSPSTTMSRQDIRVEVIPRKIIGGATKNIHIRAFCPLPTGGTEFRATARSSAFTGLVTLVQPTASASPSSTAAVVPEVRGTAILDADAKPGGYKVQVRCEATNDIGSASLKVVALTTTATPTPTDKTTPSKIPTKAPHAGGGGTAAGGSEDGSSSSVGITVIMLLAALGIGIGVVRRRSGA